MSFLTITKTAGIAAASAFVCMGISRVVRISLDHRADSARESLCKAVDPRVRSDIANRWKLTEVLRAVEDSVPLPQLTSDSAASNIDDVNVRAPMHNYAAVGGSVALAALVGDSSVADTKSPAPSDLDVVVTAPTKLTTSEVMSMTSNVVNRLRWQGVVAQLIGVRETTSYDIGQGIDKPVLDGGLENMQMPSEDPFCVEITHVAEIWVRAKAMQRFGGWICDEGVPVPTDTTQPFPSDLYSSMAGTQVPAHAQDAQDAGILLQLIFVDPRNGSKDAAKTVLRVSDTRVAIVCTKTLDGTDRLSLVAPRMQRQNLLSNKGFATPLRAARKLKYERRGFKVPDAAESFSETPSALLTPWMQTFTIDDGRSNECKDLTWTQIEP